MESGSHVASEDQNLGVDGLMIDRAASTMSINGMINRLQRHSSLLEDQLNSFDFDAFHVSDALGRANCLPSVIFKIMSDLPKGSSPVVLN